MPSMDIQDIAIILVDDDEGHAELIRTTLTEEGVHNRIVHFASGQEFLDAIHGDVSDIEADNIIVLLDLNMPGLDGFQVLEKLRANSKTEETPVAMLTSSDAHHEVERCYELGCNIFINKPLIYDDFQWAMRQMGLMVQFVRDKS